jgi:uncharacterized protein YkwD
VNPDIEDMTTRMPTQLTISALIAIAAATAPAVAGAKTPAKAHALTQCANANLQVTTTDRPLAEAAVVCLVNQQRVAHGLPALKVSSKLDHSAQGWTNTMVADNTFSHGTNFSGRISAAGFKWMAAGENIASGFSTPFSVVRAWMGDVGHCQNIMRPMFDYVGTGVNATGSSSGDLGDTWTQDFGLLSGSHTGTSNMKPADGCPYKISETTTSPTVKPAPSTSTAPTASTTPSGGPTISW